MPNDQDRITDPQTLAWIRSLWPAKPKPINFHTAEPNEPEEDWSEPGGVHYSASLEYERKCWRDFKVTAEEHRIITEYAAARDRQATAAAAAAAARWAPPVPPPEPEPSEVPPEGKLTPRQEEFCRHYAAQPVATRAAVLAGYSEDNASGYGSRLLKNPQILDRIAAFRAAEGIHYVLERDTVHDKLEALFFDALGHRNHAAAVSALKLQAALAGMFQRQPAKPADDADPQALHGEKAKKSQPRRSKKPGKAKVGARKKPGKAKKSQGKPR